MQGQAEQPRVLLVSVPYAFKAHEAETLGGKSISDFVLAKDVNAANSGAGVTSTSGSTSTQTASGKSNAKSPSNLATAQGPTNFSGTTTDQIVSAVQSGTGKAIVASSSTGNAIVANTSSTTTTTYAVSGTIPGAGVAILGHASSATAQGYGIQGTSDSNIGIGLLGFATATTGSTYGLKGYSSSTGGTGVRGLSTATTGVTTGISASVASAAGTAGVFNNTAGGKILSGQNNGAEKFSVDGSGNVNARGTFTGSGAGLTGIQFSQLVGSLASSQFSGSYSNAVTLSNTSNVYYGNGSNLTGVVVACRVRLITFRMERRCNPAPTSTSAATGSRAARYRGTQLTAQRPMESAHTASWVLVAPPTTTYFSACWQALTISRDPDEKISSQGFSQAEITPPAATTLSAGRLPLLQHHRPRQQLQRGWCWLLQHNRHREHFQRVPGWRIQYHWRPQHVQWRRIRLS